MFSRIADTFILDMIVASRPHTSSWLIHADALALWRHLRLPVALRPIGKPLQAFPCALRCLGSQYATPTYLGQRILAARRIQEPSPLPLLRQVGPQPGLPR